MWISRRELARILRDNERLRTRCEALEAELRAERAEAAGKLEAERERNRAREERLVDRVLTTKGTYAISEPARREVRPERERELTAIEEAELEMYKQSAVEQGYGEAVGQRMWERKRAGESWEELVAGLEQIEE
jgi:hypothetical protein